MFALDIDGVLADTFTQVMDEVSIWFDTPAQPHLVTGYDGLHLAWPGYEEKALYRIKALFENPWFYHRIRPHDRAAWITWQLKETNRLAMFVTSRPKSAYESTYNWLAVWGFPDVPLVFTGLRAKHHCLFPGDTLVDDNPKTVRQCLEAGKQALLFLTRYNQTEASNLPTISSLEQLLLYTAPTATQP